MAMILIQSILDSRKIHILMIYPHLTFFILLKNVCLLGMVLEGEEGEGRRQVKVGQGFLRQVGYRAPLSVEQGERSLEDTGLYL